MQVPPLISIVMPVKNAGAYLSDCLQSIIDQTEPHWELLAVNDHSTDNSFSILKEWANKDDRIEVYNNHGNGIIDALNLAYAKSKGSFISRMDADDKMAPDKMMLMKEALANYGQGHVAVGLVEYFSSGKLGNGYIKYANWLNTLTQQTNNFIDVYKECVIPSPCWMMYKTDFDICNGFNSNRYPEDYDLCFRMYAQQMKIAAVPKILHYWRDYPNRTSRTDEKYADNRFLDLKLHYFLKLDHQPTKSLCLWGAGDKGKYLSKKLIALSIDFTWLCNNPKKMGQNIYGKTLISWKEAPTNQVQYIIAVAQKNASIEIETHLKKHHLKKGESYYFFC